MKNLLMDSISYKQIQKPFRRSSRGLHRSPIPHVREGNGVCGDGSRSSAQSGLIKAFRSQKFHPNQLWWWLRFPNCCEVLCLSCFSFFCSWKIQRSRDSCDCNWFDSFLFFFSRDDWTAMAVSLSTNAVKLYSPVTGQYLGECRGHSSTINHISFSGPGNSHLLHSCSSDGTIRAWDTRTFNQVPFSF